ncbi:MAG: PPOX class F420-dependent oxidoreductase [Chloroflexota bacterium]
MINIPATHLDLLSDEKKALVYLATIMADGSPQVTPVWFNTSAEAILINSALGRVKDKNMRNNPKVALVIADPQNPYRYIQIRGTVIEFITEGAEEHIDTLNLKYNGTPTYPYHSPDQKRVIYKISPDKIQTNG